MTFTFAKYYRIYGTRENLHEGGRTSEHMPQLKMSICVQQVLKQAKT